MTSATSGAVGPERTLMIEAPQTALEGVAPEHLAPGTEKAPIDLEGEETSSEGNKASGARKEWPEGLQKVEARRMEEEKQAQEALQKKEEERPSEQPEEDEPRVRPKGEQPATGLSGAEPEAERPAPDQPVVVLLTEDVITLDDLMAEVDVK